MNAKNPTFTIWLAHWPQGYDPAAFAIAVRRGNGPVVEFRGPPYDHDSWDGSWAQKMHDALHGMHSCIIHAEGGPFVVHDKHPDFAAVAAVYEAGVNANPEEDW